MRKPYTNMRKNLMRKNPECLIMTDQFFVQYVYTVKKFSAYTAT